MSYVRLALAAAAVAFAIPVGAEAAPVCAGPPQYPGTYVCTNPTVEDCLLWGRLADEARFGPRDCEEPA